jgi:hypothetical protein
MSNKKIEDLERGNRLNLMVNTQLDDALAEIMRRSMRSSTVDLATAKRTLEEIHAIAKKARGFQD